MAPSFEVALPSPPLSETFSVKETQKMAPESTVVTKPKPTPREVLSAGGVVLPGIPLFSSFEKQRYQMLQHMAGAFRIFSRKGYSEGIAGHISLRDPEFKDLFWTNPLGRNFGLVVANDMILLDEAGEVMGGNTTRPANAAGFLIHSAIHQARPDVNAACHTHSKYGKAWSAFSRPLEMINQDVCNFYGDAQAVYNDFGGVVFEKDESLRLAKALGSKGKGMILRNHGLLTVGGTVDEAAYLFTLMERSCEIQLMVEAAEKGAAGGLKKDLVGDEAARYTFEMTSDPETLYCEFQSDLELEEKLSGSEFKVYGEGEVKAEKWV